ncbi:response regulator [Aliikangiella marina]|uniref:histidine kinase n=1 Tax=Aliikangiella marina TaxID=1712262 RepID=A0A545TDX3_9GAMM|nr:response regulator [Aliikangiella marina]TQV75391.1 response regulator [Aliikangiella marina]
MLSNTSIKTKITSIILLISTASILLVLSIFLYINHHDEQQSMINNITVLAKLIGNRSSAALTFNDQALATDNLSSLESHPSINLACLYGPNGKLFAKYIIAESTSKACPPSVAPSSTTQFSIDSNQLLLEDPIFVDDEYRGSIYICTSLEQVQENLTRYLLIALLLAIGVGIMALLFASRMQNIISNPIINLTNLAKKVSAQRDYHYRADKFGEDEVGELVESFNHMLTTIEKQNAELVETTENANQANAIKSQFLANMSHELRTPINGVLGMISLLLSTKQTQEQKEYTNLANQSGNVLLDTVNQILDLASIESVGVSLKSEIVDMPAYIDDIVQLFSSQLAIRNLDLVTYIDPQVPRQLEFDPVRVRQVFINLIANAIKFTKEGGVSINIEYQSDELNVYVEDTGIGIPEEAHSRVFESFQQVDNSSTRPFGGTGLGLPISSQICRAMGGDLKLKSSSQAGSIFWFNIKTKKIGEEVIPSRLMEYTGKVLVLIKLSPLSKWFEDYLKRSNVFHQIVHNLEGFDKELNTANLLIVDDSFGEKPLEKIVESNKTLDRIIWLTNVGEDSPNKYHSIIETKYKPITVKSFSENIVRVTRDKPLKTDQSKGYILLVDDNAINRKAIKSQLQNAGYLVDSVDNGLKAIHACREQSYDLVLMDVQMPELDGLEATRIIKKELQDTTPPIIGISAHVLEEHVQKARNAGMNDYLCKPISESDLLSKVKEYL